MMTYPALPLLQFPLLFQSSAPFLLFNQIALKEKSLFSLLHTTELPKLCTDFISLL